MLSNFRDVFLVIIGALLTLVILWFIGRRERRWIRADERRERIYGPLQDELTYLALALPRNERSLGLFPEYQRIKNEHIRYMIPKPLRAKVIQLYEEVLPRYLDQMAQLLAKNHEKMQTEIVTGLTPLISGGTVISTSDQNVLNLSNLAYWLPEGKIPSSMEREMDNAFRAVKERSHDMPESNWRDWFEVWGSRLRNDDDFKKFVGTRDQAIELLQRISKEISKDIESED